ncbi:MAG: hypothetical protein QGF09_13530 [Rhodospirillales bacterium]|jgi:hypothetical protein|nr:hypothetical protein [Rhodospirillales bacterium]
MTVEETIEKLHSARQLIDEARADCGLPQIESLLNDVDMHLHWALWNLGSPEELRHDIES